LLFVFSFLPDAIFRDGACFFDAPMLMLAWPAAHAAMRACGFDESDARNSLMFSAPLRY